MFMHACVYAHMHVYARIVCMHYCNNLCACALSLHVFASARVRMLLSEYINLPSM